MRTPASVNALPGSGASDPGWATTACLRGPTAAQHAYWTTSAFVAVALAPPLAQRTVTGQLPGVVREPTVQLQETAPLALAFFGPRPDAPEGPDL